MEIKCKCERCRMENRVNKNDLRTLAVWNKERNSMYYLLYYDCCICCKRNVVQVDNPKSKRIWWKIKDILEDGIRGRCRGAGTKEKLDALREELNCERERVAEEVEGKNFYDNKGKIIIKGLTISNENAII